MAESKQTTKHYSMVKSVPIIIFNFNFNFLHFPCDNGVGRPIAKPAEVAMRPLVYTPPLNVCSIESLWQG